jgi:ferredoxin-NADP reductase
MAESFYKHLVISDIKENIPGFRSLVFENGHGIQWHAGQYLTLVRFLNGKEERRSYSIISSPELNEPLAIGVKRVENGFFSRELVDRATVGTKLVSTGAGGFFVLPPQIENYRLVYFFAAGSGITPIFSLIKTLLFAHTNVKAVLVYSNPSIEKTIFFEELKSLEQQFSERLRIFFFFSDHPQLAKARLHREAIFQLLKENSGHNFQQQLFYICGPETYMRLCTYTLQEAGVASSQIKKENFIVENKKVPAAQPPDISDHLVKISFAGNDYSIRVVYPDSILASAKKSGIHLPYSCETGRCGNCVAICKKGKVWHSYNEVLTDEELAKGNVLTCTGHPVGGDVDIDIQSV